MDIEEHIEFITIREEFNEFEVENGQILKIKKVLTDIVKADEDGKPQTGFKIQDITHVITTRELNTEGMVTAPASSVTDEDIIENLSFTPKKSVLNIYETEKSILLIDTQVISIGSTNKLDPTGKPFLRFKSAFGINVIPKHNNKDDDSGPDK